MSTNRIETPLPAELAGKGVPVFARENDVALKNAGLAAMEESAVPPEAAVVKRMPPSLDAEKRKLNASNRLSSRSAFRTVSRFG